MEDKIIITNVPQDTKENKMRLYTLISAKDTATLSDIAGEDLIIKDFAIFERTRQDNGELVTVFVVRDDQDNIFSTTAGAVLDTLTRFFSIFTAEDLVKIHVSKIRSKNGRDYTSIDIK